MSWGMLVGRLAASCLSLTGPAGNHGRTIGASSNPLMAKRTENAVKAAQKAGERRGRREMGLRAFVSFKLVVVVLLTTGAPTTFPVSGCWRPFCSECDPSVSGFVDSVVGAWVSTGERQSLTIVSDFRGSLDDFVLKVLFSQDRNFFRSVEELMKCSSRSVTPMQGTASNKASRGRRLWRLALLRHSTLQASNSLYGFRVPKC